MKKYTVIIDSSSAEHAYVSTMFESGHNGGLAWHKLYTTEDTLVSDLKGCLRTENDEAVANILKFLAAQRMWAKDIDLTDECAAILGWKE
jgi:hypothetical protein